MEPKLVLQLIVLRRLLKGTVDKAGEALADIERALAFVTPQCRQCFYQRGLVDECQCPQKTSVDIETR